MSGFYDIETVWLAVCDEWGIPFPQLTNSLTAEGRKTIVQVAM